MNYTKVIFRPINHLKLIKSWFSEKSPNVYLVSSREKSIVTITIFCVVCFGAVAHGLDDVPNNQLKCADVPGITLLLNYMWTEPLIKSLVKFTYPSQHLEIPSLSHIILSWIYPSDSTIHHLNNHTLNYKRTIHHESCHRDTSLA